MRSRWAKIGLTSDQSSYRILQDQDGKRIPIATGVWTATVYNASIKLKRCSDKKFKRNLASQFCINLFPDLWGYFVSWIWTIRLDRIAYSLVPDPKVTAKIQLNFKTLADPSNECAFKNFVVLDISERGTGSLIPFQYYWSRSHGLWSQIPALWSLIPYTSLRPWNGAF